jgi:hypothetical protein
MPWFCSFRLNLDLLSPWEGSISVRDLQDVAQYTPRCPAIEESRSIERGFDLEWRRQFSCRHDYTQRFGNVSFEPRFSLRGLASKQLSIAFR